MATRIQILAVYILALCSAGFAERPTFPSQDDLFKSYYMTEVLTTDVTKAAETYAKEYFSSIDSLGAVSAYYQGDLVSVYYDFNKRSGDPDDTTEAVGEITDVVENNCSSTYADISDFAYTPLFHGWLNRKPLRVGPSAALWYALQQPEADIEAAEEPEIVRDIPCEKFTLKVENKLEKLNMIYYFAPKGWTTPYQVKDQRVPIRIRIVGESSRYTEKNIKRIPVDQINDFAYFKPVLDDPNKLLPPVGLGCKLKKKTDDFPDIPKQFKYSAEIVDVLSMNSETGHDNIEIQFQKVWYDYEALMTRIDLYTMKEGYTSYLNDFNAGTMYRIQRDGSCSMLRLKEKDFEIADYGDTNRMMEPKEALNLDGDFYEMGEREIRGITCDVYESVQFDSSFKKKDYHKVVVTAYFTKSATNVGVEGNTESRILVQLLITGWETPEEKTLQQRYDIFGFDGVVRSEIYSSFGLDRCFTDVDAKASFLLLLEVPARVSAVMEVYDTAIIKSMREAIVASAKIHPMRLSYLKIDYKPTGVYARGVMLDRPPILNQFRNIDSDDAITRDKYLKKLKEVKTPEQCAYACIGEGDFTCKGFYFCNQDCYLKSIDLSQKGEGPEVKLGKCTEYARDETESSNFRQSDLADALENLEKAVLSNKIKVQFQSAIGKEEINVTDILIGDGPYTGLDIEAKPYTVSLEGQKLDLSTQTVRKMEYIGSLHDCYKRCKAEGSSCASFSFCANSDSECLISSDLVIKGVTKENELKKDKDCSIYNLKFVDYFTPYPEKLILLPGDKIYHKVQHLEVCAKVCRLEKDFTCRGFEYCKEAKTCTLHKKHVLDLKPGESGVSTVAECVHYAGRYIVDYLDMGTLVIDDVTNKRFQLSLEECAKICSEELGDACKSFNYCPSEVVSQTSCALSKKTLSDKVPSAVDTKCRHYEKKEVVDDWKRPKELTIVEKRNKATGAYTKKGFTGLIIAMLALGLIIGALGFVLYSYFRSRSSDGMAVRFMKNES